MQRERGCKSEASSRSAFARKGVPDRVQSTAPKAAVVARSGAPLRISLLRTAEGTYLLLLLLFR